MWNVWWRAATTFGVVMPVGRRAELYAWLWLKRGSCQVRWVLAVGTVHEGPRVRFISTRGRGMRPRFFAPTDRQLFAVHHALPGGKGRRRVLLPVGPGVREHGAGLPQPAARLAQAGLQVLRFDYFGCGDSAGTAEEADLGSVPRRHHSRDCSTARGGCYAAPARSSRSRGRRR